MYRRRLTVNLDRLDMAVLCVILTLLSAIVLVAAGGDQTGITLSILHAGPSGEVSSRAWIQVEFSEPLDPGSIGSNMTLEPSLEGQFVVHGSQLTFLPQGALQAGQTYLAVVHTGLAAVSGHKLKQDFRWQFRTRAMQITYLNGNTLLVHHMSK